MSDEKPKSSGGLQIGFGGALQLLFIGLKLGGAIQWPWLWVMSPAIAYAAFLVFCLLLVGFCEFMLRSRK